MGESFKGANSATMKRSSDITAAAVFLLLGSGFLPLLGFFTLVVLALAGISDTQATFGSTDAILLMILLMCIAVSGWGIATGIGVLKLHSWARTSIIVMSALAIAGCLCVVIAFALRPAVRDVLSIFSSGAPLGGLIMLLMPLGMAIWWLVLFTRPNVKQQFLRT